MTDPANIPTQAHRGVSRRKYKLKVREFETKQRAKQDAADYRARNGERPKVKGRTKLGSIFAVGREREVNGVFLKRMRRKPVHYMCENDYGVKTVIAKGRRSWTVMLPTGGFHAFPTLRQACGFAGRLMKMEER